MFIYLAVPKSLWGFWKIIRIGGSDVIPSAVFFLLLLFVMLLWSRTQLVWPSLCYCLSCSLVLVNFREEGGTSVQVVMGHAVEEVEVLREADKDTTERLQTSFLPQRTCRLGPEELSRRRGVIRSWLTKNRIPVEEEGDRLRVAGVLTITAPYGPEDCCSSNQIILDRIQKLIQMQTHNPEIVSDTNSSSRDWSGHSCRTENFISNHQRG